MSLWSVRHRHHHRTNMVEVKMVLHIYRKDPLKNIPLEEYSEIKKRPMWNHMRITAFVFAWLGFASEIQLSLPGGSGTQGHRGGSGAQPPRLPPGWTRSPASLGNPPSFILPWLTPFTQGWACNHTHKHAHTHRRHIAHTLKHTKVDMMHSVSHTRSNIIYESPSLHLPSQWDDALLCSDSQLEISLN